MPCTQRMDHIHNYLLLYSYLSDSLVYEKVSAALTNSRLVKGIKQASPLDQTSCLEGFHSVLNQFSPKMIAYWYQGQYCRSIAFWKHLSRSQINCAHARNTLSYAIVFFCFLGIFWQSSILITTYIEVQKPEKATTVKGWNLPAQNSRMGKQQCEVLKLHQISVSFTSSQCLSFVEYTIYNYFIWELNCKLWEGCALPNYLQVFILQHTSRRYMKHSAMHQRKN